MTAIVQFTNVEKYYENFHALKNVTTSFEDGSITCLIGPSGSGKSTLLRCINALETIDDGYLEVLGEHIGFVRDGADLLEANAKQLARQRSAIGMVFQRFNLFPHLTVMDNVTVGQMTVKGTPKAEAESVAMEQLRNVGMDAFGHRYPEELSGGQMQRVAIARALAMRPKLMLFDEPTSALDPELVTEVLEVMRGLKRTGIAMIVVTHELAFARDVADTIVFMEAGTIVETGPAREVLTAPQSPRTKEFIAQVRT